jgi:DNA (cytosine-5)-methyltransferase 1
MNTQESLFGKTSTGALNSNRGADFGVILNEMAEAGALVQEWRVLDAQYFGVPQRRRRVFLISVFDTATATRCPDPLLPVSEGVQWHPATSHTTRQTVTGETSASSGSGSDIANTIGASLYHHGTVVNQDANNGHVVIDELPILIDRAAFNQGINAQYDTHISDDPVSPSLVARGPHAVFTKSKRPQTATDDETWVADQPNPTLNAFDQGDTRTTTVIVEDPVLMRQREGKPGGGKGPLLSNDKSLTLSGSNDQTLFTPIGFSHTQGLSAQPSEDAWPTLRTEGNGMAVAIPIQDGRDIEKHQNGLGVADEGSPSYTIDQTGAQAIAYGLQGNMIGRQDHNGPQGAGISHPNDPMFSLTSTDRHAVAHVAAGFKAGQSAQGGLGYEEEKAQTLSSQMSALEPTVLTPTMAVRRLTPLECERLMGWPDNWTATKADGTPQSDTHRYKQCGNGVASPVAQWIAQQLLKLNTP